MLPQKKIDLISTTPREQPEWSPCIIKDYRAFLWRQPYLNWELAATCLKLLLVKCESEVMLAEPMPIGSHFAAGPISPERSMLQDI